MASRLSDHEKQVVERERLRRELEMCRRIQEELLPGTSGRLPFADVRALSIPARELGGDFFNYFALPDGSAALLMGDVSGKGVPAALLMANLQATLRARLPVESDLVKLARCLDEELEAAYAEMALREGDTAGAASAIANLKEFHPDKPATRQLQAELDLAEGNVREAAAGFQGVLTETGSRRALLGPGGIGLTRLRRRGVLPLAPHPRTRHPPSPRTGRRATRFHRRPTSAAHSPRGLR